VAPTGLHPAVASPGLHPAVAAYDRPDEKVKTPFDPAVFLFTLAVLFSLLTSTAFK
jgi:hypothetical protein